MAERPSKEKATVDSAFAKAQKSGRHVVYGSECVHKESGIRYRLGVAWTGTGVHEDGVQFIYSSWCKDRWNDYPTTVVPRAALVKFMQECVSELMALGDDEAKEKNDGDEEPVFQVPGFRIRKKVRSNEFDSEEKVESPGWRASVHRSAR